MNNHKLSRRAFVGTASAAIGAAALSPAFAAAPSLKPQQEKPYEFCTFIKFIQDLSHKELAQTLKEIGFDGAEVTVRKGGYIAPEAAADELPKLAEVFKEHDLKINLLTTDIEKVETPSAEAILKTSAGLGIKHYRMGFCRYDLKAPIMPQLESIKAQIKDLAALNREHGVTGGYQNHNGAKYMGATFWDLKQVLADISPKEIGSIFDIRHAVAEAMDAWPVFYDVIKPHIIALSVKDFHWLPKKEGSRFLKARHCPLGEGQVDYKKFLKLFKKDFEKSLVTLHIEYLKGESVQANIDAMKKDFAVLKKSMGIKD